MVVGGCMYSRWQVVVGGDQGLGRDCRQQWSSGGVSWFAATQSQLNSSGASRLQHPYRYDEDGRPYMRLEDARTMFLEGRHPDGWQRRRLLC